MILASSSSNNITLWDSENFELKQNILLDSKGCISLSWNLDGKILATLEEKYVSLYAASLRTIAHSEVINHCVFPKCLKFACTSPQLLAIGGNDREVLVWDIKGNNKKKKFALPGHVASILDISFSNTDSHLVAGTSDGYGVLLSNSSNCINSPIKLFSSAATTGIKFSHSNRFLVGACSDKGSVSFVDTKKNCVVKCLEKVHSAPVTGLVFSPVNDLLMSTVSFDKYFINYNVNTKREVMRHQSSSPLSSVCFFPNGQQVALGSMEGQIMIHDLRQINKSIFTIEASDSLIKCIAVQPQSNLKPFKGSKRSSSKMKEGLQTRRTLSERDPTTLETSKRTSIPLEFPDLNELHKLVSNTHSRDLLKTPPKFSSTEIENFEGFSPIDKENKSPSSLEGSYVKDRSITSKMNLIIDEFLSPLREASLPHSDEFFRPMNISLENSLPSCKTRLADILNDRNTEPTNIISNDKHIERAQVVEEIFTEEDIPVLNLPPKENQVAEASTCVAIESNSGAVNCSSANPTDKVKEVEETGCDNAEQTATKTINVDLIRNCIADEISHMQFNINQRFVNMHWNMIKYNLQLKKEMKDTIKEHSLNEELLIENLRLQEEIKRLKATF